MSEYYYTKEDYLEGILKWEDFVKRNRNRSIRDIQTWSELRKEWFQANGYAPPNDNDKKYVGEDKSVPYHEAAVQDDVRMLESFDGALSDIDGD